MIVIIDYNIGNVTSILNMLKKGGIKNVILSGDERIIRSAEKLILPGVGHFDYGMRHLKQSGLIDVLDQKVINDKIPVLGICLGAQMLTSGSEEGVEPGLNWVNAKT